MDELDLTEVEREICRLPDVSIARLVAEPSGRVSEVHVVAHPGKHPKQIARDVQSIALASFGLELDRRIISVVQLGGDVLDSQIARRRICGRRSSRSPPKPNGLRSLVRVTLARDDEEAVGFAEGSIATTARHRLVATATVDALRQLEPAAECIDVDNAADPARRRARHRGRDRRVRDAAVGTARVGIGDRAPAARGRRGRARRARRDEPSHRVHQRR